MENIRKQIDIIDIKIQELFIERMQVIKKIALLKKENNIPIYDKSREKKNIENLLSLINDSEIKELYNDFYNFILKESKIYQEMVIGKKI